MARSVAAWCVAVALVVSSSLAYAQDDEETPKKQEKPALAGTLYAEIGVLFNLVHVPEATADAGFGFRFAVGFQFSEKLRAHMAFRSLSNENKDMPGSEEDYSDLSLGVGLSLDGKYFSMEGELTRANISGTGFSEGGLGGGVYLVAGYPLAPQVKVIGRVGAFVASVDVPSRGGERTPLWGLVGFALVYQGAPWAGN